MTEPIRNHPASASSPKVSAVIACYNYGAYLPEILASLEEQTRKDFEIIVVDDGSTDDSLATALRLCEQYRDRMPITVIHQENQGVSAARNKGFSVARGAYFMYLDPDDLLHPDYFQETTPVLERSPDIDVVYVGMTTFGARQSSFIPPDFDGETLRYWNFIPGYALFRKEVFLQNGGFRENVPSHEDWDFWLNASSRRFRFHALKRQLFLYRIHEKSLSARMSPRKRELVSNLRLNNAGLFDPWDIDWARRGVDSKAVPAYQGAKALLVCDPFPPHPSLFSCFLQDLAVELGRMGILTEVATGRRGDRHSLYQNGVNLQEFDYACAPGLSPGQTSFARLRDLLMRGRYDLVIAAGDPRSWPLWAVEEPENLPVVLLPLIDEEGYTFLQARGDFSSAFATRLNRARAVAALDPSDPGARYCAENRIPFRHIPAGVPFVASTADFRREAGISRDRRLLLTLFSERNKSAHLDFVRSLKRMPGGWMAVTLGLGVGREGLEGVKEETVGEERFLNLGTVDIDLMASAMEAADLLVLPPGDETPFMAPLHAMSHRLPWLSGDPFFGKAGWKGGVAAPPSRLAEEAVSLLSNPSLLKGAADEGFRAWERLHRIDRVARRYLETAGLAPEESKGARYVRNRITPGRSYVKTLRSLKGPEPLVSVILPTYDRPAQFEEALSSVLGQTYRHLEVIVVDDHGTDLRGRVGGLEDPRVAYHRNRVNLGLAASRNVGVGLSHGRYIAYLDDDDLFYPSHVQTLVDHMERSGMQVAYTDSYQVILSGEGDSWSRRAKYLRYSVEFSPERVLARNIAPVNCFMHRREPFLEAGGFDESLVVLEDWDLWIRLSMRYPFLHLKEITCEVRFREDKGNMSFTREGRYREALAAINRKHGGRVLEARDRVDQRSVKRNLQILSEFSRIQASSSREEGLRFLEGRMEEAMSPYLEYLCAQACLEAGEVSRAKTRLERCLDLNPRDKESLNDLAVIEYGHYRNCAAAVAYLERSLAIDPDHRDSRINLIDICLENAFLDKASEHLQAFLRSHPGDPEAILRQERMLGQKAGPLAAP